MRLKRRDAPDSGTVFNFSDRRQPLIFKELVAIRLTCPLRP
jgi:hypothetical protein